MKNLLKCLSAAGRAQIRRLFLVILLLALVGLLVNQTFDHRRRSILQQQQPSLSKLLGQLPTAGVMNLSSLHQHIFNAYLDSRVSLHGRQFIRIIAVLDNNAYKDPFVCRLFDKDGVIVRQTTSTRASKIGAGMTFDSHNYQEFVLSCAVPDTAVGTVGFVFVETRDGRFRSEVRRLRPSTTESATSRRLVVNCVSVTFGSPDETRLIEWLEAQRLLGLSQVRLHFHHITNPRLRYVTDAYVKEGFLVVNDIHCPFCKQGHEDHMGLLLMSPAINQCLYETLGQFNYTAVFDLDEIIVPNRHRSYSELLSTLSRSYNASSFAFSNWYHFFELGQLQQVSQNLQMLRHPYRTAKPSPIGESSKSIHLSDHVLALHNHFVWEILPGASSKFPYWFVPIEFGVNQHYKNCHFQQSVCHIMTKQSTRQIGSRLNKLIGQKLTTAVETKLTQIKY